MIKLLHVTREQQADKRYGLGRSLAPLIDTLTNRGQEVGYICQADAGEQGIQALRRIHRFFCPLLQRIDRDSDMIGITWGILERLNMGRLAANVAAREAYTHIHCHDPIIAAGYRRFQRFYRWRHKTKINTPRWGLTEHGFGSYTQAFHEDGAVLGRRMMRWLRNWEAKILLAADWVISPTDYGREQLARDLAVYPIPDTWHTVYHPRPEFNQYTKAAARQQLAWQPEQHYIIAVGRFAALKQFPALIQACAHLQVNNWQLVFIGEGDRTPLQQLAEQLGIADKIHFTVTDDMGLYYAAADIYISLSTTESFGLANLEALTAGLPSICTAVGGVPEVLGNGAWLIPRHNCRALVQALHTLLDSADIRHQWQQQALHWSQTWLDKEAITDVYQAIYHKQLLPSIHRPPVPLHTNYPQWQGDVQTWGICPLPKALPLPEKAKILVIAPHPDDETLGCGGTLALLAQQHCDIHILVVTDGVQGDPEKICDGDIISHRQQETRNALTLLGIDSVEFLTAPDGAYSNTVEWITHYHRCMNEMQPDWIFIPSPLDYHRDHVAISLAWAEAWQQNAHPSRLFLYETWGTLPATWVVDITKTVAQKQAAIDAYGVPLHYCDYRAALSGLTRYRSLYLNDTGCCDHAEAFYELLPAHSTTQLTQLFNLRAQQADCLAH